jgi:cyclomaltodextrinase / maltogenic alpha-amylase / neopullulanase
VFFVLFVVSLALWLSYMNIKPGRYRHFKGNEYEVVAVAKDSETMEEVVVYRALYGERGLWVRPAKMFAEVIERDGRTMPRFQYLGD